MSDETVGDYIGSEVKRFTDIDDQTRDIVFDAIFDYLEREIEIKFLAILIRSNVNGKEGLDVIWIKNGDTGSRELKTDKGNLKGHAALAYSENKELWIRNKTGGLLSEKNAEFHDKWSDSENIPEYTNKTSGGGVLSKTSIIVPMRTERGRPFGVVNFESVESLEPTETLKQEVRKLASVITHLINLQEFISLFEKGRIENRKRFDVPSYHTFKSVGKTKVFVAFADKCCQNVITSIKTVLEDRDDVSPVYWDELPNNGRITTKIIQSIHECRKAICYLSEINSEGKYFDNPNVLIELGMTNALSNNPEDIGHNLIPIREANDLCIGKLPFDIADSRLLIPERTGDKIKDHKFRKLLTERIDLLVRL